MKSREIARAMMAKRGISASKMANMLNYAHRSTLNCQFYNKGGIKLSLMARIADLCGFEIVLRDTLSDFEMVIDPKEFHETGYKAQEEGYGYVTGNEERDLED